MSRQTRHVERQIKKACTCSWVSADRSNRASRCAFAAARKSLSCLPNSAWRTIGLIANTQHTVLVLCNASPMQHASLSPPLKDPDSPPGLGTAHFFEQHSRDRYTPLLRR